MPRKNPNKSFYHYSVKEYDKLGNIINIKFYMTLHELQEDFKVSLFSINQALNKENYRLRKYKTFQFDRVRVPVYKRIVNDVFSHNYITETDTEAE